MPKGSTTITDILNNIFLKTPFPWAADANITAALHTANPGIGGSQSTSEANYTGYARVNIVRTASGWTVSGATAKNAAQVAFAEAQVGSPANTIIYLSLGINSGQIAYIGSVPSRTINEGIQPIFAIESMTVTES